MRVLVGVDLERDAERIVDLAVGWVVRLGATAHLAHVSQEPEDVDALARLLERFPLENRGSARVHAGRPVDVLAALASAFDLVILGTHGRQGVEGLVLGSVAERIVRTSAKPVLVARDLPPPGSMEALCAVDVHDPRVQLNVDRMLPWLENLGATADLTFVERIVIPATPQDLLFAEQWMAVHDARETADYRRLEELVASLPAPLRGRTIFEEGDVARGLIQACIGRSLAIVVTHGRTGLERWWLGSVAEPVVRMASCSVLALHAA